MTTADEKTPAPAEVPMPDAVAYANGDALKWLSGSAKRSTQITLTGVQIDYNDTPINTADQMRTYGAACRAAGYERGLKEANRYRHLRALVVSDSYAATFQSLAQYRIALLKSIDEPWETAQHAPAEVLMPKPVAYGFGNTAITGHTNRLMMVRIDIPGGDQYAGAFWLPLVLADEAHTYGIACRAAGEAAGYARGLRDAVRDADIEALRLYVRALCKAVDAATDFAGTVAGGASWWDDVWADHAAALDRTRERISQADLRGEVKP